jgi:hypothetical protein
MGRAAIAVALTFTLAAAVRADVEITAAGDRIDVSAARAPLSDVLDGLARKTRMKVVYEGAAPRTPVTVELRSRTPAQAVLGVLDGLGLSYALVLDVSGTQVETLMMIGGGPGGASAPSPVAASSRPARNAPRNAPHANLENPEVYSDEPVEIVPVPEPVPAQAAAPDAAKAPEAAKPPAVGPLNPTTAFPVSPFAPGPPMPVTAPPSPAPSPNPNSVPSSSSRE